MSIENAWKCYMCGLNPVFFLSLQCFCVDLGRTFMAFVSVSGEFCQAQHLSFVDKWIGRPPRDYATQKPPWIPAVGNPDSSKDPLGYRVVLGQTALLYPRHKEKSLSSAFFSNSQSQTTLLNGVNWLDDSWIVSPSFLFIFYLSFFFFILYKQHPLWTSSSILSLLPLYINHPVVVHLLSSSPHFSSIFFLLIF